MYWQIIRRGSVNCKETEEVLYYITSLQEETVMIANNIHRHLQIESEKHWVLGIVYREDDSRIQVGDTPQNMTLFRHFAFNLSKLQKVNDSMKGKLKRAAWDDAFRGKLLFG